MAERRFDSASLRTVVRTDEGYLLVEGFASRPGILEYTNPDGSTRRELVPEDELSRTDSLATLARKPVTLGHPEGEFVSPENVEKYQVGDVAESIEIEELNGFVKIRMAIRKKDAIDAVEKGTRELSVGYTVDLEKTPGEHPVYGRYDAIQRNRRYNHVAIVPAGRAGTAVGLRADDSDAGGLALSALASIHAELKKLRKEIRKIKAEAEAATEPVENEDRLDWFNARTDALEVAKLVGADVKPDADLGDIRRAVVEKHTGGLDSDTPEYIAAAFSLVKKDARENAAREKYKIVEDENPATPPAEAVFRQNMTKHLKRR